MSEPTAYDLPLSYWTVSGLVWEIALRASIMASNPKAYGHNKAKIEEIEAELNRRCAASTQDAPTEVGETMIPLADAVRVVEEFFWPDDRTGQRAIAALQALGGGE